jgi:hypothetical protein
VIGIHLDFSLEIIVLFINLVPNHHKGDSGTFCDNREAHFAAVTGAFSIPVFTSLVSGLPQAPIIFENSQPKTVSGLLTTASAKSLSIGIIQSTPCSSSLSAVFKRISPIPQTVSRIVFFGLVIRLPIKAAVLAIQGHILANNLCHSERFAWFHKKFTVKSSASQLSI